MDFITLCSRSNIDPVIVLNLYQSGSRVYGTATPDSDWDFLAIIKEGTKTTNLVETEGTSLSMYEPAEFQKMIDDHNPQAILCLFLPDPFVWKKEVDFRFEMSISKLKFSFMRKSCSCFNRAKSYFKEGDKRRLKKMIVHSFRYLLFGKQLIERKCIYDYTAANSYYYQVTQDSDIDNADDWKIIESKYKPIQQQLLDDSFPKSIEAEEFLESDTPLQIAELKRFVHFPGAFVGQEDKAILEIIRTNIVSEDEFNKEFPQLAARYQTIKSRYEKVCEEIQSLHDSITKACQDDKTKIFAKECKESGQYRSVVVIKMKAMNIDDAKTYLALPKPMKSLIEEMLHDVK